MRSSGLRLVIALVALSVVAMLVGAAPVAAQQPGVPFARVMVARAPVYAGPGLGFWQLGALRQDVITPITGVSADRLFWKSDTPIGTGYLRAQDVIVSSPETVPVVDPGPIGTVTAGVLNVRIGPGIGAAVVGGLRQGAQFFIIGRQPDGSWLEIRSGVGRGWVKASLTSAGGEGGTGDQVPPSTDGPVAIINTAFLNVRSGPATFYTKVGALPGGTRVPIVGKTADGQWLLIEAGFGRGWINLRYVLTQNYFGSAPVVGVGESGVTPGLEARTRTTVNLRSGPGIGFPSLGQLTLGVYLNVLGQSPDGAWWFVDSPAGQGWINKTVVRTAGDFSGVPVVNP